MCFTKLLQMCLRLSLSSSVFSVIISSALGATGDAAVDVGTCSTRGNTVFCRTDLPNVT